MSVTRRRALVAIAMVVAVAFLTAGFVLAANKAGEPSAEAIAAIETLSAPSIAGPLPFSTRVAESTYQIPGNCAAARSAYLAPDAPVPVGASVAEIGTAITIELPFARSGIVFADVLSAGHCLYTIEQAPTLSITGSSPAIRTGDYFARVLCYEDDVLSGIAEFGVAGQPLMVMIVSPEVIGSAPGSITDLAALETTQPFDATVTMEGSMEAFSATAAFADGTSLQIDARCTGSTLELMQMPG